MSDYPVDVPNEARAVKANYPERPSQALVKEIKQFIADTGTPYLWQGHTHTKPLPDSVIVYCGEFDLPKTHSGAFNRALWSPCPCCHSETAWFYKDGKIAWFPNERVIRNIGKDCFKKINSTGHDSALALYQLEEKNRKNLEYLLGNLHVVPEAVRLIESAKDCATDVDTVRRILAKRLSKIIDFDIWNDLRVDGALKRHVKRTENFVRADGTQGERPAFDIERHAGLDGYTLLNPHFQPMAPRLEKSLQKLRTIDFGNNWKDRVEAMSDIERHTAANNLAKPISSAREIFSEIEECRRFLSPVSISTLNAWGRHEDSPASLFLELKGAELLIGLNPDKTQRMKLGNSFFQILGELPRIGDIREV